MYLFIARPALFWGWCQALNTLDSVYSQLHILTFEVGLKMISRQKLKRKKKTINMVRAWSLMLFVR